MEDKKANRFRFRFWDTSISGFQYFEFEDFKKQQPEVLSASMLYLKDLQQSTGLVDKNGVEIFEGDIVKDAEEDWQEHQSKWVIKWECNPCAVGFKACYLPNMTSYEELLSGFYQIEVIGNIHQNPEMLK